MNEDYKYYGMKCSSQEVSEFVKHIIVTNEANETLGKGKTPVCIWGKHGIGKTDLVKQITKQLGYDWTYIAPAQFEEMGDLIGMPTTDGETTNFAMPDWVPKTDGPGVLLIDDVNRADDRILRGIMQLLQNYELVSWELPAKWQIILTANPDGGDYSVTSMDDAMLTRMMHITMQFDVKSWSRWAHLNNIDPRGINFLLTYPEMVNGELTTPRSLVQFFNSIETIPDLQNQLPLVYKLAASCLDEETVSTFVTFIQQNLTKLIEPEKIVNTKQFERDVHNGIYEVVNKDVLRVDILATISTRLSNYLLLSKQKYDEDQLQNIRAYIKMDYIPNDLRLILLQEIMNTNNESLKQVMLDPEVSMMLLENM